MSEGRRWDINGQRSGYTNTSLGWCDGGGNSTSTKRKADEDGNEEPKRRRLIYSVILTMISTAAQQKDMVSDEDMVSTDDIDIEMTEATPSSLSSTPEKISKLMQTAAFFSFLYKKKELNKTLEPINIIAKRIIGDDIETIVRCALHKDGRHMDVKLAISVLAQWVIEQGCIL